MRWAVATRVLLARRPWIGWIATGAVAAGAVATVHHQVDLAAQERRAWGRSVAVWVAPGPVPAGAKVSAVGLRRQARPVAAVPDDAVLAVPAEPEGHPSIPPDAALTRALRAGDVLTERDLGLGDPRFALVPEGHVVVALPVAESVPPAEAGDLLQLAIDVDGLVVAVTAVLIERAEQGWSVAVPLDRAGVVAAAAAGGTSPAGVVLCGPGGCHDAGGVQ